jgi:4-diphosphocytidyl-2-C-methyl-D-erythritol kinase
MARGVIAGRWGGCGPDQDQAGPWVGEKGELGLPLTETAYAKINLALHIRRRRDDGYHELEILFAFAEDGDMLSAEPTDTLSLTISGPFAQGLSSGPDNLVLQAAARLQALLGTTQGAALHLDKRLPVAAGIGGGSADAAAVLRLLPKLWGVTPDPAALHALASDLGADVPACLASQTVRGEGVGDVLVPVEAGALSGLPLLLVNPGIPCPTGPIFKAWDGVDRGALGENGVLMSAQQGRNDLQMPSCEMFPEIKAVLDRLNAQPGTLLVRMSGSGATCFALFDAEHTVPALPAYWSMQTRLR